jgi:hypothetical protein
MKRLLRLNPVVLCLPSLNLEWVVNQGTSNGSGVKCVSMIQSGQKRKNFEIKARFFKK